MSTLAAVALAAVLFVVFGLVRPRAACDGKGCAACGASCPRHPHPDEDHHVE